MRNPTFVIFADLATQEKENYFFMSGAFILMRDHFNVHIVPRIFKEEISLESMKEFTRTQDHTVRIASVLSIKHVEPNLYNF